MTYYGPRELVLTDDGWKPRAKEVLDVSPSAENVYFDSLEGELSALSEKQKFVMELRFYKGYTCREIAAVMGISYQAVSRIEQRARRQLERRLTKTVDKGG